MFLNACLCSVCQAFQSKELDIDINLEYFWKILKESGKTNNSYRKLICEKTFYLRDDSSTKEPSSLTVGIDPENEFFIYARLKIPRCGSNIILDAYDIFEIFDYLDDNISKFFPQTSKKSNNIKGTIMLQEYEERFFKLHVHENSVVIDDESLKKLYHLKEHIIRYAEELHDDVFYQIETLFFRLMSRFYVGKTIQKMFDLSKTDAVQKFFKEQMKSGCYELNSSIISEIAANFENFFITCLPYFIKTVMLAESKRLETFKNEWSRNDVSIKSMASSGLYFTGKSNLVKCTFCCDEVDAWTPYGDPFFAHYESNKYCPFLRDHKKTSNVSDVTCPKKLEKRLILLRKIHETDESDSDSYLNSISYSDSDLSLDSDCSKKEYFEFNITRFLNSIQNK